MIKIGYIFFNEKLRVRKLDEAPKNQIQEFEENSELVINTLEMWLS